MENQTIDKEADAQSIQILEVAWRRYSQLDARASTLDKSSRRGGFWTALLGILFVVLAVLFDSYGEMITDASGLVVKALLVVTPLLSALIAAYSRKAGNQERMVLRGGADEILKDIYIYRTILVNSKRRRDWLGGRLVTIQRQLSDALDRELSLQPYNDQVPPGYSPDNLGSDPGFTDLSWNDYMTFRLENRLAWHIQQNQSLQVNRSRLVMTILLAGGAGAILAALGGPLTVWGSIIAPVAYAQYGWNELRQLDKEIQLDNKVIAELMSLYERWSELPQLERTEAEYNKLVATTEQVLWNKNIDYIQSVQQVLLSYDGELMLRSVMTGASESVSQAMQAEEVASQEVYSETDADIVPEMQDLGDLDYGLIESDGEQDLHFPEYAGIEKPTDDVSVEIKNQTEDLILLSDEAQEYDSLGSETAYIEIEETLEEPQVLDAPNREISSGIEALEIEAPNAGEFQVLVNETLEALVEEYSDTTFNRSTPVDVINEILSRFQSQIQDNSDS